MGTRCADHVTPLYPQKLALNSPTGGGRSVGIVRVRTKATELSYIYIFRMKLRVQAVYSCELNSEQSYIYIYIHTRSVVSYQ